MCRSLPCWLLLIPVLSATGVVHAQGTAADYDRMHRLRDQTRNTVSMATVQPHWLPDGDHFWYRLETRSGQFSFYLVDCNRSRPQPAFNPEKLAAALSQATSKPIDARRLPFADLEWDFANNTVSFEHARQRWTWSRKKKRSPPGR